MITEFNGMKIGDSIKPSEDLLSNLDSWCHLQGEDSVTGIITGFIPVREYFPYSEGYNETIEEWEEHMNNYPEYIPQVTWTFKGMGFTD